MITMKLGEEAGLPNSESAIDSRSEVRSSHFGCFQVGTFLLWLVNAALIGCGHQSVCRLAKILYDLSKLEPETESCNQGALFGIQFWGISDLHHQSTLGARGPAIVPSHRQRHLLRLLFK